MPRLLLCLAVLLPALARADGNSAFDRVKGGAEAFDGSLSAFLERYVGECPDKGSARECKDAADAFRKKVTGKRFLFLIGEEQVANLAPGRVMGDGSYTLNLTPFFAAGNYAVSQGAPHHTDARGNPVFPFLTLKGQAADGMEAQRTLREVANRSVRVELVFTPQGVWALPGHGRKLYGVKATFNGVRATSAMTGQPIATYVR